MSDELLLAWLGTLVPQSKLTRLRERIASADGKIGRAYQELIGGEDADTSLKFSRRLSNGEAAAVVTVKGAKFTALCPHHFLPFYGEATLEYKPQAGIVGLGKIPRFIKETARGFWLQEDLTVALAEDFARFAEPVYVQVELGGTHLCVCGRGPHADIETFTSHRWEGSFGQ